VELLRRYSNQTIVLRKLQHLLDLPHRGPESARPVPKQDQHRLTADQQVELLGRYLAGERAFELAKDYGVNRNTVAKLLADTGMRRPRSLTPDEVAEAVSLYNQGWSCERIGQRFGRNHSTVWLALKAAGVQLRQPWDRPSDPGAPQQPA